MFYSANTKGFYDSAIHGNNIPADAVEITVEEHAALIDGQSKGRPIKTDLSGRPFNAEPPPRTAVQARAEKLAALAARRYAVETGGITVGGINVATDRESQAMLTGAWVRMQKAPDLWVDWKGDDGWSRIDKATVDVLAAAVGDHVQACFTAERVHAEAVIALPDDVAIIDGYDFSQGWPGEAY